MNPIKLRRIVIVAVLLLIMIAGFFSFNLLRFSPEKWLQQNLPDEVQGAFTGELTTRNFGTQLNWNNFNIEKDQYQFTADELQLTFNPISILIGQPLIKEVTVLSPYLEIPAHSLSAQHIRIPLSFNIQNLTLTNGLVVTGNAEFQNIELSMVKNGSFGEYAVQFSGQLETPDSSSQLNYSMLIGIDGDDNLVLGKNQFETRVIVQNWTGRLTGKIKSLRIDPNNNASFKFVSWSSAWKTNADNIPYTLDWAGGLSAGTIEDKIWTIETFDSALAYVDKNDIGHTFAIQSNSAQYKKNQLAGQLGLSLLTEYPIDSEWQSYNLVLSGILTPNDKYLDWANTDIALSMIDDSNSQETHRIQLSNLIVDRSNNYWLLDDGDWKTIRDDAIIGDYGFGSIKGEWPSMQITEAPTIAQKLQPSLDLISSDIEYLNALYNHLVP